MDRDWRCQKYGPLGWMEAVVKLIAIGVGFGALSVFYNRSRQFSGTRIGEIVLLCVIGAAYIAMVVQRILDKELFALCFMGKSEHSSPIF
jgi:hypothetical protein